MAWGRLLRSSELIYLLLQTMICWQLVSHIHWIGLFVFSLQDSLIALEGYRNMTRSDCHTFAPSSLSSYLRQLFFFFVCHRHCRHLVVIVAHYCACCPLSVEVVQCHRRGSDWLAAMLVVIVGIALNTNEGVTCSTLGKSVGAMW